MKQKEALKKTMKRYLSNSHVSNSDIQGLDDLRIAGKYKLRTVYAKFVPNQRSGSYWQIGDDFSLDGYDYLCVVAEMPTGEMTYYFTDKKIERKITKEVIQSLENIKLLKKLEEYGK